MRTLTITITLLLAATTWECSTESSIPLGEPSAESFDRRLLGSWDCRTGQDPTEGGPVNVYAFNDREFSIWIDAESDDDHIRAFSAKLDASHFLNVQILGFEPPGAYSLVGYEFDSSTSLTLRIVDLGPKQTKPRTQTDLVAFLRRRLAEGALFDDDFFVCEKSRPKGS